MGTAYNICCHVLGSELSTVGRGMRYLTRHEMGHNLTALCMHKIDKLIQYFFVLLLFSTTTDTPTFITAKV